jgi:hypothetical protein
MNIWGMLMQVTNEDPLFLPAYTQTTQVRINLTRRAPSWRLIPAIQSDYDRHILHRQFLYITGECSSPSCSFSKLCLLCYLGSLDLSGSSQLLIYLSYLLKVIVSIWVILSLPLLVSPGTTASSFFFFSFFLFFCWLPCTFSHCLHQYFF